MAIEDVFAAPAIGEASVKTLFTPVGMLDGEPSWTVIEVPKNSGLISPAVKDIADAESQALLKQDTAKNGILTPDKPGRYMLQCMDVISTVPIPKYAGEVVTEPTSDVETLWDEGTAYEIDDYVRWRGYSYLCVADNVNSEPYEAPVSPWVANRRPWDSTIAYVVNQEVVYSTARSGGTVDYVYRCVQAHTNQTPDPTVTTYWVVKGVRKEWWCAQWIKRQIGEQPNSATLRVKSYDDLVPDRDKYPKTVELVPADTPAAKIAVFDASILHVLDEIREAPSVLTQVLMTKGFNSTYPYLGAFYFILTSFNAHLDMAAAWKVHEDADANVGSVLASTATVTTLAGAISQLNDIRLKFLNHMAQGATVHDTVSVLSVPSACSKLSDALTLADALWLKLGSHASNHAPHYGTANEPIDGRFGQTREAPTTLDELLDVTNDLTTLYEHHRVRTDYTAPHAAADAANKVRAPKENQFDVSTPGGFIALANLFADCLERHGHNMNEKFQDVTTLDTPETPYHQSGSDPVIDRRTKVGFRANDVATAWRLLESCYAAYEAHVLDTSLHGGNYAGGSHLGSHVTLGQRLPACARLTKYWLDATKTSIPTLPANLNESANELILAFGWTLFARRRRGIRWAKWHVRCERVAVAVPCGLHEYLDPVTHNLRVDGTACCAEAVERINAAKRGPLIVPKRRAPLRVSGRG